MANDILFSEDLTPLFHWNTKQLFLYLEAEYENAQGVSLSLTLCYGIKKKTDKFPHLRFHSRCYDSKAGFFLSFSFSLSKIFF